MYKHLLVATDGSRLSGKAVTHAIALAQALKAELTAFYASPDYPIPAYADGVVVQAWTGPTPFRATHRETFDGRPAYFRLDVWGPSGDHRILTNPIFVRGAS